MCIRDRNCRWQQLWARRSHPKASSFCARACALGCLRSATATRPGRSAPKWPRSLLQGLQARAWASAGSVRGGASAGS
eukprot:2592673-Alexandrium_andersonii.AAC.1